MGCQKEQKKKKVGLTRNRMVNVTVLGLTVSRVGPGAQKWTKSSLGRLNVEPLQVHIPPC